MLAPPAGVPDPLDELPDLPRAPLHIRVRSLDLSFSANWSPDSNSTTTGLPGPGLVIGRLFSAGGRRLETIVNRTAAVVGLGYEGIARRLLVLMRGRHARCAPWVDFSSAPVLDLAIELGSGFCEACGGTYFDAGDKRIGRLVARLLPAIQSVFDGHMNMCVMVAELLHSDEQLGNRLQGSRVLGVLAASHSLLQKELLQNDALRHVELALHSSRRIAAQDVQWRPILDDLAFLQRVLRTCLTDSWYDVEVWARLCHNEKELLLDSRMYVNMLKGVKLEYELSLLLAALI
jgi:hypothetical protein